MTLKTKVAIGIVVILGLVGSVVLLFFASQGFSARPTEGQHLRSVDWLPAGASDVSFYRNGDPLFPMYAYECTLSYEDLMLFSREKGWNLEEKRDTPLPGREFLKLPPISGLDGASKGVYASALSYETVQGNGGGIFVVYHRPSARLFVHYSAH